MLKLNLQHFAEAGTLVNATGNYVNAYDGKTTNFDGANTLTPTMKTYYDTELLENARAELVHTQFGKKQPLPSHRGKQSNGESGIPLRTLRSLRKELYRQVRNSDSPV